MQKPYAQYRTDGSLWKAGHDIWGLCAAWNHATDPSRLMTDREHTRAFAYARAIRARMRRLGYVLGRDYVQTPVGIYPAALARKAN